MKNAEWMIKQGYKFSDLELEDRGNEFKIYLKENCVGKYPQGFTMLEAAMKWLDMEHIEPILDDTEKQYLSAIIEPFRDDVLFIMKYKGCFSSRVYEEIAIWYRDKIDGERNYCMLPKFEKGTMYKNMEVSKHYTLEELGL